MFILRPPRAQCRGCSHPECEQRRDIARSTCLICGQPCGWLANLQDRRTPRQRDAGIFYTGFTHVICEKRYRQLLDRRINPRPPKKPSGGVRATRSDRLAQRYGVPLLIIELDRPETEPPPKLILLQGYDYINAPRPRRRVPYVKIEAPAPTPPPPDLLLGAERFAPAAKPLAARRPDMRLPPKREYDPRLPRPARLPPEPTIIIGPLPPDDLDLY